MKKLLLFVALWLAVVPAANAANVNIDGLPAAASVIGANLFECEQGGVNNKCTATQMAAYIYGLMSGDATASGTGAVTFATVNANVGSFGSATQCTAVTVNAKGLITAASAATCTPAMSSVTGRAALSQLPQGIANSIWINPTGSTADMQNVAVPACANDGAHALVYVNGTGLQCASITGGGSSTITAGTTVTSGITSGHFLGASSNLVVDQTAVTSVATGCGAAGGPITGTGTISAAATLRTNSATTDTIVSTDGCNVVTESNAASVAVGIAVASTTGFTNGIFFQVCNIGVGVVTITPTTSTIGGASSKAIQGGTAINPSCLAFQSDGTNYNIIALPTPAGLFTVTGALKGSGVGVVSQAACADLSNGAAGCSAALGTGVATALAVNVGTAGSTVVNGGALGTPSGGTLTSATGLPISTGVSGLGTGVAAAAGTTLSAAGGLTTTIASGTAALGTGAISSATCATVVTSTATNTATTDVVLASFNGDPTAVTGYSPVTTGALTLFAYPTANTFNVKVCNLTSASITPGAITLNWRVVR